MKNFLLISTLLLCLTNAIGQSKNYKYGVAAGAYIQHYNGNLGNSFLNFNTTCFGGGSTTFGMYLNKSFDVNLGVSIGDFGYCQTEADASRFIELELRCPGCTDRLGMGELRSRMVSGNIAIKYKVANDFLLKEDSKFSPYIYMCFGLNHLADNMRRNCVTEGFHFSINGGAGVKYNISDRFNIGYNVGVGYFPAKKVYAVVGSADTELDHHDEVIKMEKRKDMYMQNTLSIGINFN